MERFASVRHPSPNQAKHTGKCRAMFEILDRQTRLTGNQKKILAAAIIGDALEFFDYSPDRLRARLP